MKGSIIRKILAIIAFWVLALFGGALVLLWNALAPYYMQFHPGDLGYALLVIASTPVGVALAASAADSITDDRAPALCMVNCVVAATLLSAVTVCDILLKNATISDVISMLLAVIVAIGYAYAFLQNITKEVNEKCERLQKQVDAAEPVMDLFRRFAKRAGMTLPEYTAYIRTQAEQVHAETE